MKKLHLSITVCIALLLLNSCNGRNQQLKTEQDNSFIEGEYLDILNGAVVRICDYNNGQLGIQITNQDGLSAVSAKMKLDYIDKDTLVTFTDISRSVGNQGQYDELLQNTKISFETNNVSETAFAVLYLNSTLQKMRDYPDDSEEYAALVKFFNIKYK